MKAFILAGAFLTAISARAEVSDFSEVLQSKELSAAVGEEANSLTIQAANLNGHAGEKQFLVSARYEGSSCAFDVTKVGAEFSVQSLGCTEEVGTLWDPANAPTFTQDIKPVFKARCSFCHGPGKMRPQDFTDYNTVIANKDAIVQHVLTTKDMPMGTKLDPATLSLISAWIKAGAPQ